MTLNTLLTSPSVIGTCSATLLLTAAGVTLGATLSTTLILIALAAALGVVIAVLGHSAPSPSVVQILRGLEAKDDK